MSKRTQETADSRGELDVLLSNTEAKLSRQQKVTLAFGDLNLDGDILVVGLLSDTNDLVTGLVVTELIAQGKINAKIRSSRYQLVVIKAQLKWHSKKYNARKNGITSLDRGKKSVPSSTDGIRIVRLNYDLAVHSKDIESKIRVN